MRRPPARCRIPSGHTPRHPLFELPFFPLGNAAHHAGRRSHVILCIVGARYLVPSLSRPKFYQRRSYFTSFTSLASFTSSSSVPQQSSPSPAPPPCTPSPTHSVIHSAAAHSKA